MTAVENLADELLISVVAYLFVLGIFALLLAVVGPIFVVSFGVDGVRWMCSLLA